MIDYDKIPPFNDESVKVSIKKQISRIENQNFWFYSSSVSAIWDNCEQRKNDNTDWMYVSPYKNWYPGEGLTDSFYPIKSENEAKELIKKARQKWIDYAKINKIKVKPWQKIDEKGMISSFEMHSKELCSIIGAENLDPLAIKILNLNQLKTRKEIPLDIVKINDDEIKVEKENYPNRNRRNRLAFQLYSRLYNYANAKQNNAMFLTLSIPNPELHGVNDEKNLIAFGLRLPK